MFSYWYLQCRHLDSGDTSPKLGRYTLSWQRSRPFVYSEIELATKGTKFSMWVWAFVLPWQVSFILSEMLESVFSLELHVYVYSLYDCRFYIWYISFSTLSCICIWCMFFLSLLVVDSISVHCCWILVLSVTALMILTPLVLHQTQGVTAQCSR